MGTCLWPLAGLKITVGCADHPLLVTVPSQDFLIVDRQGPGENLEEVDLAEPAVIVT